MANTLTNLIPDIYAALDVVERELVGFITAVSRDSTADRLAINQTLRIPIVPSNAAVGNITPAMSIPSASDQTIANTTITISKQRFAPFSWTGEEQKAMDYGPNFLTLKQYQIAQALRALVNEIETDLATAAYKNASRAYGTSATTPFGSTLADTANLKKILDDNGAPMTDRQLIIDTTAGVNLRLLTQLTKVNEAGTSATLRQGTLLDVHGFGIRESAQVVTATGGTMSSGQTDGTNHAVGATTLTLGTAGTGVVSAGDVIALANDTANKYVVTGATFAGANPAAGDTITIGAPGLRKATTAVARVITVSATGARNVAFTRNSIFLATRLPAIPAEGDLASDRMTVTDPNSGLSFEFALYPGFRMNVYHVSACWGYAVIKPAHVAVLLG